MVGIGGKYGRMLLLLCFQYVGMYVTTTVGESAVIVTVEDYTPGMAPALLINHTERVIQCSQE